MAIFSEKVGFQPCHARGNFYFDLPAPVAYFALPFVQKAVGIQAVFTHPFIPRRVTHRELLTVNCGRYFTITTTKEHAISETGD